MCQSIWWSGQGILHEQVSVTFDKREALWILMQNGIELIYIFGIKAFKFFCKIFSLIKWLWCRNWCWSAFLYSSKFTLTSKKLGTTMVVIKRVDCKSLSYHFSHNVTMPMEKIYSKETSRKKKMGSGDYKKVKLLFITWHYCYSVDNVMSSIMLWPHVT